MNYENTIKLVANSAQEIRKCDVYRLMESAQQQGIMNGLTDHLFGIQFELQTGVWQEVKDCLEELA